MRSASTPYKACRFDSSLSYLKSLEQSVFIYLTLFTWRGSLKADSSVITARVTLLTVSINKPTNSPD